MRSVLLVALLALGWQGLAVAEETTPAGDYADGLSGGPDYWEVSNLASGDTLKVRKAPGPSQPIVGELGRGDRVRNLGCRMQGSSRWCQVEAGAEQSFRGWVNGHYLRESAASAAHDSKGSLPCSTAAGQPTGSCPFRASRGSGGSANVWITLPSGKERYIQFREGKPVGTDPGLEMSFEHSDDLTTLRIGAERYEIPDAVIYGG